jgi:RNA polymerase sigma-70 factor (ECF subfamily)
MTAADPKFLDSLIQQAREGDSPARERLLIQFQNYLLLLARLNVDRHLRPKVDPLDLVQETYLRAHRDFAEFRGSTEAELSHWLRTIMACVTSNLVRHYYSAQRRNVRLERQLEQDLNDASSSLTRGLVGKIADPHSSPSQHALRLERARLLADALAELPEDYQEVITLNQLQGLPMREVAERMGRSVYSVQKLWSHALLRLPKVLSAD